MLGPFERVGRFLRELRRRNVYKVAVAYAAVAFVSLQAVAILVPATTLPGWADELLLALLIAGFPVSLVVAWAFEVTPDGIRRSPEAAPAPESGRREREGERRSGARRAGALLVGLGALGLAVVGGWYLMGSGGARSDAGAGGTVTERSIAVLPFETLGEAEATAFTDGIHGDLLTRLSGISDLRVTSRTSVMRYRQPERSLPSIAAELGVAWVLRGEVQRSGSTVQVQARLVDAREDRQVWADRYRRELTADDLFAIQEEIAEAIVHQLQAHLSPMERQRLARRPTGSLEAYRLYVRGRSLLDRQTEGEIRQAADWFRRAIARDSSYALAWSGLADALLYLAEYGYATPDSVLPAAEEAVRRAVSLEPESAEAHVSRAFLHAARGNGPMLLRELERAIELRPSYAQARSLLGWYYPVLGRPGRGLESARKATETDPFAPEAWVNLALGYLTTGHPDSALGPARRTRELQDDFSAAPFYEALAFLELGRPAEADSLLAGIRLAWAPPAPRVTAALVSLERGDTIPARELLETLPDDRAAPFYRGLLHAALGEVDAAFDAFARIEGWNRSPLLAWPGVSLRYLYSDALEPVREDPRYARLVAGIDRSWGLPADGGR